MKTEADRDYPLAISTKAAIYVRSDRFNVDFSEEVQRRVGFFAPWLSLDSFSKSVVDKLKDELPEQPSGSQVDKTILHSKL